MFAEKDKAIELHIYDITNLLRKEIKDHKPEVEKYHKEGKLV